MKTGQERSQGGAQQQRSQGEAQEQRLPGDAEEQRSPGEAQQRSWILQVYVYRVTIYLKNVEIQGNAKWLRNVSETGKCDFGVFIFSIVDIWSFD